jgi:hypothetical protein
VCCRQGWRVISCWMLLSLGWHISIHRVVPARLPKRTRLPPWRFASSPCRWCRGRARAMAAMGPGKRIQGVDGLIWYVT